MLPDLATTVARSRRCENVPHPAAEYVKGWGLMAQVFESGDVLALRVFPEGTFGGFRAVWHRDPRGRWSMYIDSVHPETACPRYFGAAIHHTGSADVRVVWTAPATARVTMARPALDWTFTASATPLLRVVNSTLPLAGRQPGLLERGGGVVARLLGLGRFPMTMTAPSGHLGTLLPTSMFVVDCAHAVLEGRDLGRPVRSPAQPRIGAVDLPARAVLATGEVVWRLPGGPHPGPADT
jgi:hypothetical protein